MKIIGGLAKGHDLFIPKGIRPTSTLLKRKLFDSHQSWKFVNFVDLCAGSGSIGLEAWSRGAESVHLVEKRENRSAVLALKKNTKLLSRRFPEEATKRPVNITKSGLLSWISSRHHTKSTVFYLDPPYSLHNLYLNSLEAFKNLKLKSILWIQSNRFNKINQKTISSYFDIVKTYTHSNNILYKVLC